MNILHIILGVLMILGITYVFLGYKEGFTLSPGNYPCTSENPILVGDYPIKKNPQLSSNTYEKNAEMTPYTNMAAYEQSTNNVKNWVTPDDGSCSPAEFCGALYNKKVFETITSNMPNDNEGTRVNYYVSHD